MNRGSALLVGALVGLMVFAACLVGIFTRLPETLAVFWPANALLLGLALRKPHLMTPITWLCACAGYVGADAVAGTSLANNVALNLCNVLGIGCGVFAARFITDRKNLMTSIRSLAGVACVVLISAGVSAVCGGFANVLVFDIAWGTGFTRWFAGELLNYMALLPVVLTWPAVGRTRSGDAVSVAVRRALPAAVLLAVCLALMWVWNGPGAIAFTMPALVLAALMTNVFVTSLFIATSTAWTLQLIADGRIDASVTDAAPVNISLTIGLSFLAVGPIAVACIMYERERALTALRYAVVHDDLTGAMRRDEFFAAVRAQLAHRSAASLLMMDLDHFKRLNDGLGHRAGDDALVDFAQDVRRRIDEHHLFARLGGEEFAIYLPDVEGDQAVQLAESIRLGQTERSSPEFGPTVSIGVATTSAGSIDELLDAADRALYDAKRSGRNRTVAVTLDPIDD